MDRIKIEAISGSRTIKKRFDYVGQTSVTKEVPLYAINTLLLDENHTDNIKLFRDLLFVKPFFQRYRNTYKLYYNDLLYYLKSRAITYRWRFERKGDSYFIVSSNYYIADDSGNILFIITVTLNNDVNDYVNRNVYHDTENLNIYVSNEFMNNPIYKTIYNKIKKEIINDLVEKGASLITTSSKNIEKKLFQNKLADDIRNNSLSPEDVKRFIEEKIKTLNFRDNNES